MTIPSIIFSLVLALLYGAIYHIVRGGNGWRLLLYFGLSVLGFAAGQIPGLWLGWKLLMMGAIDLGAGTIGSALFLFGGDWLSRIETGDKSSV
jgi:hypothetical protein